MDLGVVRSVGCEVMATGNFAQLSALGHDFRYGDGHVGGGPIGSGFYVTGRGVTCTRCGRNFEFKRVPNGPWELDNDSKVKLRFSCADFRAQNTAIRRRWAQLFASWSKN